MAETAVSSTVPAPVRGLPGAGSPQTPSKSTPSARGSAGSPATTTGDGAAEGGPSAPGRLGQFRMSAPALASVLDALNTVMTRI